MTTDEKLRRDLATLKDSIQIGIEEKQRRVPGAGEHLAWCIKELRELAQLLQTEMDRQDQEPEQKEADNGDRADRS